MAAPDNVLLVEGICAIAPTNTISVLATYICRKDKTGKMVAASAKPARVTNAAHEPTKTAKKSRIPVIQPEPVV